MIKLTYLHVQVIHCTENKVKDIQNQPSNFFPLVVLGIEPQDLMPAR